MRHEKWVLFLGIDDSHHSATVTRGHLWKVRRLLQVTVNLVQFELRSHTSLEAGLRVSAPQSPSRRNRALDDRGVIPGIDVKNLAHHTSP
jgi:hypothetical protein